MNARAIRVAIVVLAVVAAFFAGAWLGDREQTCAAVPARYGTALVCSSELREYIVQ